MKIYTSYYGQLKNLVQHGIEPIAISRGVPTGFAGRRVMVLAPTWAMLKMSDEDYDKCYENILAHINRDALVEDLAKGGDHDVALLCWEKDINDCHRKRVGEWLREGGYEVEEFQTEKQKADEVAKEHKKEEKELEKQALRTQHQITMTEILCMM